ncbi:beta-1,4-N-acetylgalactosaminyltransferase 3-like [Ptychodera flava]|uniref:beta-1,4-N-acetylgalactosaminyltransferase 3-like n=1 Tax=Ptychodera flava TaxID=63121 RepID=UPI00396A51E1
MKTMVNIEEIPGFDGWKLYLTDMELEDGHNSSRYTIPTSFSVSDYVVITSNGRGMCRPGGYLLSHRRMVHVIVTASNLGQWTRYFVNEMERLYRTTGDQYFRITIVDFGSVDVNMTSIVENSLLANRITVIHMSGYFVKTLGFQKAVGQIKNPADIVFLCDLHLEIPTDMIDRIRKHVIKTKMVYAPVVAKLECGKTTRNPTGVWDMNGYGLLGITKYDWDKIGGMNTKEFVDKWGGEDWEFIDRIIQGGLQVVRHRVPYLYHYYHSKKGMWTGGKYKLFDISN